MGYFYFDESIHNRGGFILGAFIYSDTDISQLIFSALSEGGLTPEMDEFKSSINFSENPEYKSIRDKLKDVIHRCVKIGLLIVPVEDRDQLGIEAVRALNKIINANFLNEMSHEVYVDEGISLNGIEKEIKEFPALEKCKFLFGQDSKKIAGIQLADLAAHILSTMLLETLGHINKRYTVGAESGYVPDIQISLGFELWTVIRRNLFTQHKFDLDSDAPDRFNFETGAYALYIAEKCTPVLRAAAIKRFGTTYYGCLH